MKRKITVLNVIMQWSALAFLLLLPACHQGPDPVTGAQEYDDILANAGEVHNQMITYYYANRTSSSPSPETMFSELMDLSFEYLGSQGYREASLRDARMQVEEKYGPTPLKGAGGHGFCTDPETYEDQLNATGLFSGEFVDEISEILDLAKKNKERKEIRNYVNEVFAGIGFDRKNDCEAQRLFIDIFNGSYEYWESFNQSTLKGIQLKPSSWVIINDGIGGIIGSIFGPIGSIVTATVFSVGTNEEIKD
ncbi:MAG: hypothetical protein ACWGNV_16460 [Bacteroidales bacterium]